VWWDPAVLRLEVEELAPLRHQRILEMDDAGAAEASERSYAAWKSERESLLTKASEPSLFVRTITSHIRTAGYATEASGQGDEPHVHIERLERADQKRPGGRRFGALVHALLASIDLKANADAIQAAAIVHGRMVGATEHEISAAISDDQPSAPPPGPAQGRREQWERRSPSRNARPPSAERWMPCRRSG
jgi:ATP-dependent helicase/nuclease subunit A